MNGLKLEQKTLVYINGKDKAVIKYPSTKEDLERFETHMNAMYKSGWNYLNVVTELNHFKW